MAVIEFKKGDEYMARLEKLERETREKVIGPAIYEGAKIAADAIADRIPNVPVDESWGTDGHLKNGPKEVELRAVYNGMGIAKERDENGFINVKIGWGGYDKIKTERWPNGRPVQMLARSIERGTTFMKANPFVKPAMAAVRNKAVFEMGKTVDRQIEDIMTAKKS